MDGKGFERPLALAGIGYLALGFLGSVVYGEGPDFVGDPGEIAAFYAEDPGSIITGDAIYLIAGLFLLCFVAGLRTALQRADGPGSALATLPLIGGVAGTALMMGAAGIDAVGALRADDRGSIEPATAAAIWDISGGLFGLAAPVAWAAAVLATAMVALRSPALPSWLGAVSVVMGLALLILPIAYISILVMGLWAAIAGVVLFIATGKDLRPAS